VGEKAEEVDLGEKIQAVFLKLRRRISGFNKSLDTFYTSTEHNTKDDVVYLFGAREKGRAEDLYEKHKPILKAQRVVYAYLIHSPTEKELVRLIVKGASLSPSKDKDDEHVDLLSYVQQDKPKGTHTYQYVTEMTSYEKSGPLGKYFAVHFERGGRIPDEKLTPVIEVIKELAEEAKAQDEYYKENTPPSEALPVIDRADYPEEDINIDDIPF
jgi:hypothetical protein